MSGEMFFIMTPELCVAGELFNFLCPSAPPYVRSFSVGTSRRLFRMIAEGVAHMHRIGCYHRDLKLENLVVTGDFTVKIMDFGSAKFDDQLRVSLCDR
jgi:serine/threonine protein kinase